MKLNISIVGVLLAAYLLFILALFPANVAVGWLPKIDKVKLGEVSGSIWQSHISALEIEQLTVFNIQANLSPWSLMTMSPKIGVFFGDRLDGGPLGHIQAKVSNNSIHIADSIVDMSANQIAAMLPLPIPIEAFGNANVVIESLTIEDNQCKQAKGTIGWTRAAVTAMDQSIELGAFSATLQCQNGRLAVVIEPKNRLGLSYTALVSLNGKVSGKGYLEPGKDFPKELHQILPFIGNPDAQGRYQLNF